jgi:hypothetical protein
MRKHWPNSLFSTCCCKKEKFSRTPKLPRIYGLSIPGKYCYYKQPFSQYVIKFVNSYSFHTTYNKHLQFVKKRWYLIMAEQGYERSGRGALQIILESACITDDNHKRQSL